MTEVPVTGHVTSENAAASEFFQQIRQGGEKGVVDLTLARSLPVSPVPKMYRQAMSGSHR